MSAAVLELGIVKFGHVKVIRYYSSRITGATEPSASGGLVMTDDDGTCQCPMPNMPWGPDGDAPVV